MSGKEPVAPDVEKSIDRIDGSSVETQPPPETPKTDAPVSPDPGPEKEQKTGTTETDQDRNWKALRESRDFWEREARSLRQRGAEPPAETKPPDETPELPAPKVSDFDLKTAEGTQAYTNALVEHGKALARSEAGKIVDTRLSEYAERQQEEARARDIGARWDENAAKFAAAHKDFDQVTSNIGTSLPEGHPLVAAIRANEHGPAIAYHLGQNPAEAFRIANLDPQSVWMTVGALSARFNGQTPGTPSSATPPTSTTKAPAPPTKVGSGTATPDTSPESATDWRDMESRLRSTQAQRR